MNRWPLVAFLLSGVLITASVLGAAQVPLSTALEETVAPGANDDKAEFRLWIPSGSSPVEAIVVLVPGSNGDGRPMADDATWQSFATKHRLALLACRFTDKTHDQPERVVRGKPS